VGITAAIQNRIVRTTAAILCRSFRAAKLDPRLYAEVMADRAATGQAMAVVLVSAAAAGIGVSGSLDLPGVVGGTIVALVGWLIWAFLTYSIGARSLPEPQTRARSGELLRPIGFASAPGLTRVFAVIPGLAALVFVASTIWMLVSMAVAVRQALGYTGTLRAVRVCLIGWFVQIGVFILAALLFGLGQEKPV